VLIKGSFDTKQAALHRIQLFLSLTLVLYLDLLNPVPSVVVHH